MGKLKKGILGGFSGKVGTVVGGSWKGVDYMRSQAQSVYDAKSERQVSQRTKFQQVLKLLRVVTPYVRVGFRNYAVRQTAFNAAMSYNLKNAFSGEYPNFVFQPQEALVSRGLLVSASDVSVRCEGGNVTFGWVDNSGEINAKETDWAMPLVFNLRKNEAVYSTTAEYRRMGSCSIEVPANWVGDECYCYLGFASTEEKDVSNSVYVGSLLVA